jgi:hypothetical protein
VSQINAMIIMINELFVLSGVFDEGDVGSASITGSITAR